MAHHYQSRLTYGNVRYRLRHYIGHRTSNRETAPILVTAGYAAATNWNPFSEWMTALPVFIYRQLTNPTAPAASDPSTARAWAGALVLIVIVMGLNLGARAIAKHFAAKTAS